MKITETRKAIIELIEPYMDKTLSEGCLLGTGCLNDIVWEMASQIKEHYSGIGGVAYFLDTRNGKIFELKIGDEQYRYGHYDITAVLKYIEKKGYWIEFDCLTTETDCYFMIKDDVGYDANLIGTIQNKPLHLYSEEEDKQLLDLLLKLK